MSADRPRRAPYAREIEAAMRAGQPPRNLRLIACEPACERWPRAQDHRATTRPGSATLLPAGFDPLAIQWPAVQLIADVTGLPSTTTRRLAQALARDGAMPAWLIDRRKGIPSIHLVRERKA